MVGDSHCTKREENPQLCRPDPREREAEDPHRVRREEGFSRHEEIRRKNGQRNRRRHQT